MKARINWLKMTVATVGAFMLIGVSSAQAATVICGDSACGPGNFNVTRVENLEIVLGFRTTFYNVDFINDKGSSVYSGGFDFSNEANAAAVREQLEIALNQNDPTPRGASSAGTQLFYIGIEDEQGFIEATGSEYRSILGIWDICETGCIAGERLLNPSVAETYAKFNVVPVPAAVWLLGGGLIGLVAIRKRPKK